MTSRALPILCALALMLPSCSSEPDLAAPPAGEVAKDAGVTSIAGTYEVSGVTVVVESGDEREISGTVILAQEGDRYTATFNLGTMYPLAGGGVGKADVIGVGEGHISGSTLLGSAHTQIVSSTVPGVDPGFAFIRRNVSTRIISSTATHIASDGTVTIEISNHPAGGENYTPTRTTLKGSKTVNF